MKNKEIKKELLKNNGFRDYRKQRFSYFENGNYELIDSENYFYEATGEQFTKEEIEACYQMKQARKEQVKKIRDHFTYWLQQEYKIFFMTFTYDNEKRKKDISNDTFKKYVIRALGNFDDYIVNIDYGTENERVHFHALAMLENDKMCEYIDVKRNKGTAIKPIWKNGKKLVNQDLLDYENKVGFYDAEPCEDTIESAKKLSRYIDKLTLHSVKVKQSYVSVKKGTEYQQYKKFKKNTKERNERLAKINKSVSYMDYLNTLRKNKAYIKTNNFCEMEYQLLDNLRQNKAKKLLKIDNLRARKHRIMG